MNFFEVKKFMDDLTNWIIPGNSISICLKGKEVFNYSSGFADLENRIPMSSDNLINIYSCSKVVTVIAALQLYEKGYFTLQTPIYEFIPEFKDITVKESNGIIRKANNPITMFNLFTMTSGLNYDCETKAFTEAKQITNGKMNTLAVIKRLASEPLAKEPNTEWMYGLSHDVLAAIVEVIAGKKFREYVKQNIFEPLDMKNSYYHNEEVLEKMAEQYMYKANDEENLVLLQSGGKNSNKNGSCINVGKKVSFVFGPEYDSGGAGITTTVNDFSKLCNALSLDGVSPCGERILLSDTLKLMKTSHLNEDMLKQFNWPQLNGYGYGLGVRTLIDKEKSQSTGNIGEFGWGGAAGATVLIDSEIGLSVFYAHHMLNPQEEYYQPRLRNAVYNCLN